jgi:hypothetical protein
MMDIDGAIDHYHQSLSRKPDDPFASEMLNRALQDALETKLFLDDDHPPPFASSSTPFQLRGGRGKNLNLDLSASTNNMEPAANESMMTDDGGLTLSVDMSSDDVDMSLT